MVEEANRKKIDLDYEIVLKSFLLTVYGYW